MTDAQVDALITQLSLIASYLQAIIGNNATRPLTIDELAHEHQLVTQYGQEQVDAWKAEIAAQKISKTEK